MFIPSDIETIAGFCGATNDQAQRMRRLARFIEELRQRDGAPNEEEKTDAPTD